jgi:hypothetical protein
MSHHPLRFTRLLFAAVLSGCVATLHAADEKTGWWPPFVPDVPVPAAQAPAPGGTGPLEASSKEILNSDIGPEEIHLYTNPADEHDDFLKCVRTRKDPYFPVDIGHRVSTICHMANIAIKLGRKLKWDPVAEQFTGDAEALALMDRPRRDPWQLPKVP